MGAKRKEKLAGQRKSKGRRLPKEAEAAQAKEGTQVAEAKTAEETNAAEAEHAGAAEVQERQQPVPRGPYVFASCHEDVLQYLQPQFVCYCETGKAPLLLQNPKEGCLPQLTARLSGNLQPIRHSLLGHWQPTSKKLQAFHIMYKGCKEQRVLKLHIQGGDHIDWLRPAQDNFYVGKITSCEQWLRVRSLGPREMEIQFKKGEAWQPAIKAKRRQIPAPHQALELAKEPEAQASQARAELPAVLDYDGCRRDLLEASGWHLPPDWAKDGLYKGLARKGDPITVRSVEFRFNAKFEQVDDNQCYLATYVGQPDGSLGPSLENVSNLFDCPFSGLCVHRVDKLALGNFRLGVITGPSGSGKSTLARDMFGPSPKVSWLEKQPVLAHFSSPERATDVLAAASLDRRTAMRPYDALSGGEQARAHLARILDLVDTWKKTLVIEEFTSLVDRATAKKMARGLQKFVRKRMHSKIVVVSCHSDFVEKSFLEPDWLFETHTHRLLSFETTRSKAQSAHLDPILQSLQEARNMEQQTKQEMESWHKQMFEHAGKSFLTAIYRNEAAAIGGALKVLGDQELRARQQQVAKLEKDLADAKLAAPEAPEPESDPEVNEDMPCFSVGPPQFAVPELKLEIRRALPREWAHFREHHYKDHSLHTCCVAFVALLDGRACCFCSVFAESFNWVQRPGNATTREEWHQVGYPCTWHGKNRKLFRENRTVVLPDFQGMGLASLTCDTVGAYLLNCECDFTSQTVHPYYGSYRDRSPFWRALPSNRNGKYVKNGNLKYSHVFLGAYTPDGKQDSTRLRELRRRAQLCQDQPSVLVGNIPELN
ncbi:unnamed protein product [Effrenium voratum]|nr:unnamed protein product [Effrenium voratum]